MDRLCMVKLKDKLIHKILINKPNEKKLRGRLLDKVNTNLERPGKKRIEDADDRGVWKVLMKVAKNLDDL